MADAVSRLIAVKRKREAIQRLTNNKTALICSHSVSKSDSTARTESEMFGWLGFNGTFSTNRSYHAIKKINFVEMFISDRRKTERNYI